MFYRVLISWVAFSSLFLAMSHAEDFNILNEEMIPIQKLKQEVENLIKRGAVVKTQANQYVSYAQDKLNLMMERNKMLTQKASSRHFTVYAASKEAADTYLEIAEKALKDYSEMFPMLGFTPTIPAQILLYPEQRDYLHFEGVHPAFLGHAMSNRQTITDLVRRGNTYQFEDHVASNKIYHRYATFQQDHFVAIHETCHLFTYEIINPSKMDIKDLQANRFLNEGISEFFACKSAPEHFAERVAVLLMNEQGKLQDAETMANKQTTLANVNLFLAMKAYPQGKMMSDFYAEATIFTRWVMEFPSGNQLIRNLILAPSNRMEELVKLHQSANNLPQDGFGAYADYRQKTLEEVRAKYKIGSKKDPAEKNEKTGKKQKKNKENKD